MAGSQYPEVDWPDPTIIKNDVDKITGALHILRLNDAAKDVEQQGTKCCKFYQMIIMKIADQTARLPPRRFDCHSKQQLAIASLLCSPNLSDKALGKQRGTQLIEMSVLASFRGNSRRENQPRNPQRKEQICQ